MLRTRTQRTQSLVDLNTRTNASANDNKPESDKPSTASQQRDVLTTLVKSKTHGSDTQLNKIAEGFRCPVAQGKKKVATSSARPPACLVKESVKMIGHNGVALDPENLESIEHYLGACSRIVYSSFTTSPNDEVGRMRMVSQWCMERARDFGKKAARYEKTDSATLSILVKRTARAMAQESNAGKMMPPGGELARLAHEYLDAERVRPFADKLVVDRSRMGQADRVAAAWEMFHGRIVTFAHAYIAAKYPDADNDNRLQIDPHVAAKDPQRARREAVARSYDRIWQALENQMRKHASA